MGIITVYGIKACDTMKKARSWLEANGVDYSFHDYKAQGVTPERLAVWIAQVGWEKVLNRNGTTFRKLAEDDRADLTAEKAIRLMVANPSMIKRPIIESEGALVLGFNPSDYQKAFC